MFDRLTRAPEDPILGLIELVRADKRPEKLDLGIGVYVDESGQSPVMSAVRRAELEVLTKQTSKAYLSARGNHRFLELLGELAFSSKLWSKRSDTIASLQTTGCVAALRLAGDILKLCGGRRIWVSGPTWPVHEPIFRAAGLETLPYPYYSVGSSEVNWTAMLAALEGTEAGDAVLLHGSCHNPTGMDLDAAQWSELATTLKAKNAIPLVDVAYAGFGDGWNEDLAGVRGIIDEIDEAIVAFSCSKSFGLYRERTGALFFAGRSPDDVAAALSNALVAARVNYSMPPDHGAAVVAEILSDPELKADWEAELARMRGRIIGLREKLAAEANRSGLDWNFLTKQRGMFSLLPLSPSEVAWLAAEKAIYMPGNGRICLPGLSNSSCEYLARSCALRAKAR